MRDHLLLIDGQNYAYRAFFAYSKLRHKGKQVGMIYGMPSMIGGLIKKFKPCSVIICWESDRYSEHRLKVHPDYKKRNNRKLMDYPSFLEQKEHVQKALSLLGIAQVYIPGLEGDDVIYKMSRLAYQRGFSDVSIVSGDKDFNQCIEINKFNRNYRVKVYNENKKEIITIDNCKKIFGYSYSQTVDYLILTGDKSDNIPGYGGIGEVKAKAFLDKVGSIKQFLASNKEYHGIDREKLLRVYKRNRILIDLKYHYEKFVKDNPKYKNKFIPSKKMDKLGFRKFVSKLNMQKLMSDNFLRAFE